MRLSIWHPSWTRDVPARSLVVSVAVMAAMLSGCASSGGQATAGSPPNTPTGLRDLL
jgi:hypothetical protein